MPAGVVVPLPLVVPATTNVTPSRALYYASLAAIGFTRAVPGPGVGAVVRHRGGARPFPAWTRSACSASCSPRPSRPWTWRRSPQTVTANGHAWQLTAAAAIFGSATGHLLLASVRRFNLSPATLATFGSDLSATARLMAPKMSGSCSGKACAQLARISRQ
jgi:hypothetical protein